jgi:hypothetical protein
MTQRTLPACFANNHGALNRHAFPVRTGYGWPYMDSFALPGRVLWANLLE